MIYSVPGSGGWLVTGAASLWYFYCGQGRKWCGVTITSTSIILPITITSHLTPPVSLEITILTPAPHLPYLQRKQWRQLGPAAAKGRAF